VCSSKLAILTTRHTTGRVSRETNVVRAEHERRAHLAPYSVHTECPAMVRVRVRVRVRAAREASAPCTTWRARPVPSHGPPTTPRSCAAPPRECRAAITTEDRTRSVSRAARVRVLLRSCVRPPAAHLVKDLAHLTISPGDPAGIASPHGAHQKVGGAATRHHIAALPAPHGVGVRVVAVRPRKVGASLHRVARVVRDGGHARGGGACGGLGQRQLVQIHIEVALRQLPEGAAVSRGANA
jgi:hypothetical protein